MPKPESRATRYGRKRNDQLQSKGELCSTMRALRRKRYVIQNNDQIEKLCTKSYKSLASS